MRRIHGLWIILLALVSQTVAQNCVPPTPPPPSPICSAQSGYGSWTPSNPPPGCWAPYDVQGPWNTPVPPNPRLDPNDAAIKNWMFGWPACQNNKLGVDFEVVSPPARDWSHPVYFATASDPMWTIHCVANYGGTCGLEGQRIRIPAIARPAAGSDHHLGVIDQSNGMECDMFGFGVYADGSHLPFDGTGNAPQVQNSVQGDGRIYIMWGDCKSFFSSGWGTASTASRAMLWGGVIRAAEWQYAADHNLPIPHALFSVQACSNADKNPWYPASSWDTPCAAGVPAPHYGQRMYLDMTDAEIDALPGQPWQKVIYRTLAHYGCYFADTNGSWGFGFVLDAPTVWRAYSVTDPYTTFSKGIGAWQTPEGSFYLVWQIPGTENLVRERFHFLDQCVNLATTTAAVSNAAIGPTTTAAAASTSAAATTSASTVALTTAAASTATVAAATQAASTSTVAATVAAATQAASTSTVAAATVAATTSADATSVAASSAASTTAAASAAAASLSTSTTAASTVAVSGSTSAAATAAATTAAASTSVSASTAATSTAASTSAASTAGASVAASSAAASAAAVVTASASASLTATARASVDAIAASNALAASSLAATTNAASTQAALTAATSTSAFAATTSASTSAAATVASTASAASISAAASVAATTGAASATATAAASLATSRSSSVTATSASVGPALTTGDSSSITVAAATGALLATASAANAASDAASTAVATALASTSATASTEAASASLAAAATSAAATATASMAASNTATGATVSTDASAATSTLASATASAATSTSALASAATSTSGAQSTATGATASATASTVSGTTASTTGSQDGSVVYIETDGCIDASALMDLLASALGVTRSRLRPLEYVGCPLARADTHTLVMLIAGDKTGALATAVSVWLSKNAQPGVMHASAGGPSTHAPKEKLPMWVWVLVGVAILLAILLVLGIVLLVTWVAKKKSDKGVQSNPYLQMRDYQTE